MDDAAATLTDHRPTGDGATQTIRRYPESLWQLQSLADEYEVGNLIEIDGKVPLNYFTYRQNFGDLISPWLIKKMTGREVVTADRNLPHYVAIGSIAIQTTKQSIAWGTGSYGTEGKREIATNASFCAVRGPLTQAKLSAGFGLGIPSPRVYGDPALLLPLYFLPEVPITHEYGVAVRWNERTWAEATYGPSVKVIDFGRSDVEGVVRELLSCRHIITSSLHGLILADTYGIPNAWLASGTPRGGVFKFYDYFASVNKFRQPHTIDLASEPVTVERLRESVDFSAEKIEFDYRALLDAAPFMRRRGESGSRPSCAPPTRQPGPEIGTPASRAALLPALGFFGGIGANYLSIPVDHPVSRVRLSLSPDVDTALQLRGLELYNEGEKVAAGKSRPVIAQTTSDADAAATKKSPFAYGGIRTEKEPAPWWQATFPTAQKIDEIRVYNRRDGWGDRANTLTVSAADTAGYFRTVSSVDSAEVVTTTLALLERLTGLGLEESVLDSVDAARQARQRVLAELARRAADGLLTPDREEQRLLAALIRHSGLPDDGSLSDDEWTLLGHLLAAERLRVPDSKTSVMSYHRVLKTGGVRVRLEAEVNRAVAVVGGTPVVIGADGLSAAVQ